MVRLRLWPASLPFLYASMIWAAQAGQGRAADAHTFIMAASEGYGVEECLAQGGDCGRIVADAWCEAHGHGASTSFGVADDITGAIGFEPSARARPAYFVRCGD